MRRNNENLNLKLVVNNVERSPKSEKPGAPNGGDEIKEYVDGLIAGNTTDTRLRVTDLPEVTEFNGPIVDEGIIDYARGTWGKYMPTPEVTHLDDSSHTEKTKDLVANSVVRMAHDPDVHVVPSETEARHVLQADKDA